MTHPSQDGRRAHLRVVDLDTGQEVDRPDVAHERMQGLMPDKGCNGYWYGHPGLDQVNNVALAA